MKISLTCLAETVNKCTELKPEGLLSCY